MQSKSDRLDQGVEQLAEVRQRLYSARFATPFHPDARIHIPHYDAILKDRLDFLPDTRALDIGCGYGNLLAYYRWKGIKTYLGIDNSPHQIDQATRVFGAEHARMADGLNFLAECTPGDWDIISAIDFVEHLAKVECLQFLSLAYRALTDRGILLVRTPNANSPWGMSVRYNDLTHEICFTPNSFRDTAAACGFERVECWEDIPMVREGPREAARWLGWQAFRLLMTAQSLIEVGRSGSRVFSRNMWNLARKTSRPTP